MTYSKVNIFGTEPDTLEKVLKTFNKDQNAFDAEVANIKSWMQNQPHFPEILETKAIGNFLLLNKCDVDRAKEKINMYYTIRSKLDDIYDEVNPKLPHMKQLPEIIYVALYPKLTKEMYRLCFFKIHNKALAEKWQPVDAVRFLNNIQEVRIREDVAYGDIYIADLDGITFAQQLKITPVLVHKCINLIYKKVYNLRIKAIYLMNFPSFGKRVLELFKKFAAPKIADRIHIISKFSELQQHFPIDLIPKDFGGEGAPLCELQNLLGTKIFENQDLFDRLDNMRVDENLRPEKVNDELLGFYGNFKKLEVD